MPFFFGLGKDGVGRGRVWCAVRARRVAVQGWKTIAAFLTGTRLFPPRQRNFKNGDWTPVQKSSRARALHLYWCTARPVHDHSHDARPGSVISLPLIPSHITPATRLDSSPHSTHARPPFSSTHPSPPHTTHPSPPPARAYRSGRRRADRRAMDQVSPRSYLLLAPLVSPPIQPFRGE
jgi:hypothetical protein